MNLSVDASLKKFRTTYIDLFYVHWWDYSTPVEEVMNGLHNLVVQGKVLYLVSELPSSSIYDNLSSIDQGISDAPAWIVAKANQYARDHGKTPFIIYQGKWSILDRSFEREIIPMARSEGMYLIIRVFSVYSLNLNRTRSRSLGCPRRR